MLHERAIRPTGRRTYRTRAQPRNGAHIPTVKPSRRHGTNSPASPDIQQITYRHDNCPHVTLSMSAAEPGPVRAGTDNQQVLQRPGKRRSTYWNRELPRSPHWGRISQGRTAACLWGRSSQRASAGAIRYRRSEDRPPPSPTGGNGAAQAAKPKPPHREDPVEKATEQDEKRNHPPQLPPEPLHQPPDRPG